MATDNEVGLIGFFSVFPTQDKQGFIGALLVTDRQGKPEDFRMTLPIKPTGIQKMLYGPSLNRHVGVTLCGVPLFNTIKKSFPISIMVICDTELLTLADEIECKIVYLAPSNARQKYNGPPNITPSTPTSVVLPQLTVHYPTKYTELDKQECASLL